MENYSKFEFSNIESYCMGFFFHWSCFVFCLFVCLIFFQVSILYWLIKVIAII